MLYVWAEHQDEPRILTGHAQRICCLCFAPNEQMLVSADCAHLCVWDVPSGSLLCKQAQESISAVAFAANGKRIAALAAGSLLFWDIAWVAKQARGTKVSTQKQVRVCLLVQAVRPACHRAAPGPLSSQQNLPFTKSTAVLGCACQRCIHTRMPA